jgi:hypothetical protein
MYDNPVEFGSGRMVVVVVILMFMLSWNKSESLLQ